MRFLTWTSTLNIPWSTNIFISAGYGFLFLLPALVMMVLAFVYKHKLFLLAPKTKNIIWISMGIFAFIMEFWFDLVTILYDKTPVLDVIKNMLITCRFNMYMVAIFLIARKPEFLTWIYATTLFGGAVTVIGMPTNSASFSSLFRHGYVLFIFPTIAFFMTGKQFSFNMYIKGYAFSLIVVGIQIGTNYLWDLNAGELREDLLIDNPLVGFMPYGGRIFLWVFIVILVQNFIFLFVRYSHQKTYGSISTYWKDLILEIKTWSWRKLVFASK